MTRHGYDWTWNHEAGTWTIHEHHDKDERSDDDFLSALNKKLS